ncbi:Inhibin beta C chain [Microtus ochrogaster]|uniref:Inhibin beta C chain n=1 Tax=Microtus ochrogaster TaxID=79684 RepID=A0A8J6GM64_MICOH|nr:Inhibin beta C chain [Microtus ochrogaster]
MFSCSISGKKESCQPEVNSSQGPWQPEQSGGHYCRDPKNWIGILQGGPSPAMASFLFLLFLLLTPDTVANLKTDGPCPACSGAAFDLESQRELLLDLAKKSILNKLHLRQRPTLSRPVSRAALKTALWRLRAPRQETLLEQDQTQEYEIISFAETAFKVLLWPPSSRKFMGNSLASVAEVGVEWMIWDWGCETDRRPAQLKGL